MPARCTALGTDRLQLRGWRADDSEPFARLNADSRVMRYFPAPLTACQSDALMEHIRAEFVATGWGLWALEERASGEFIGFTGLARPDWEAHFTPCVEIGWRLRHQSWGRGYASEAAREVLRFAFEEIALSQLYSFTVPANRHSQAVMVRIGMERVRGGDFDHPRLPPGSLLRRHILYRMDCRAYQSRPSGSGGV